MPAAVWNNIETLPCRGNHVWLRWSDGREAITEANTATSPKWWQARSATHWRMATKTELARFRKVGTHG